MNLVDTHAHLNFSVFAESIPAVLNRAQAAGVGRIVVVGTTIENSQRAVSLAQQHEPLVAAVGIHPHHVFAYSLVQGRERKKRVQHDLNQLEELIAQEKVVAVGEIGLDRHQYSRTKYRQYQLSDDFWQLQEFFLKEQLKLALKHRKPVIFHNRGASQRLVEILEGETQLLNHLQDSRAVFHCCEPDQALLDFALMQGLYLGVAGDVTHDDKKQQFVKHIPLVNLVLETDAPFFIPRVNKESSVLKGVGQACEPYQIKITAHFVAKLRGESSGQLTAQTTQNAQKLFAI